MHHDTTRKSPAFDGADAAAGGTPRPFAKAVRAGDFVYVSGQVPTVDGEVVTGGIIAQTEAVMKNIIAVLKLDRLRTWSMSSKSASGWMIHETSPVSTQSLQSIFLPHIRPHARQCKAHSWSTPRLKWM